MSPVRTNSDYNKSIENSVNMVSIVEQTQDTRNADSYMFITSTLVHETTSCIDRLH